MKSLDALRGAVRRDRFLEDMHDPLAPPAPEDDPAWRELWGAVRILLVLTVLTPIWILTLGPALWWLPLIIMGGGLLVLGLRAGDFVVERLRARADRKRLRRWGGVVDSAELSDIETRGADLTMPVAGPPSAPTLIDDPRHARIFALVADWTRDGLRPADGRALIVPGRRSITGKRASVDELIDIAAWFAMADDVTTAWLIALILGEPNRPRLVGRAVAALVARAPDDPMTQRVVARARADARPAFQRAARLSTLTDRTGAGLDTRLPAMGAVEVLDVTSGLLHAVRDADDPVELLLHDDQPAVRLGALLLGQPGEAALRRAAIDPLPAVRLVALEDARAQGTEREVDIARLVLSRPTTAFGSSVFAGALLPGSVLAERDPTAVALGVLGEYGDVSDARRLDRLAAKGGTHGPIARSALGRLRARLRSDPSPAGAGRLAIVTDATLAGGLSAVGEAERRAERSLESGR